MIYRSNIKKKPSKILDGFFILSVYTTTTFPGVVAAVA
jgi:hypothetical protein